MNSRILIADSNKEIRDSLSMALSGEGFNCVTADDGGMVIELVKEDNFDILIGY